MKKPRTRKDLKADPRVAELWFEPGNGWCIQLAVGWAFELNHQFQIEPTIREACDAVHHAFDVPGFDGETTIDHPSDPNTKYSKQWNELHKSA